MPGSIHVSVLGLIDLPSPPPLSSLSLTVAMGKREYQTFGGGELSFPVVSLRENLVVMVHDAEGEEILRTEFSTMLLLERGLWDNLFPLMNGGSLHMKLQFLLSEEDRKRIREMRDSVLKKRCMDKTRTRHRRSFSDNRIGGSLTRTIPEIITEGMLFDHSEPADPRVEPYFGPREKFPASRIGVGGFPRSAVTGERYASNLEFPQTMSKSFSTGMLSEISSHGKSKHLESFFLKKNKETQNVIPAMHYETLGNKDIKYDEKIHKLDIGTEEVKLTKNTSSDADPHSGKSNSSITIDNVSKTTGSRKSTSLVVSAGTSSERKDFASVGVEKGSSTILIIRHFETVGEKESLNLMQKGGASLGSKATSETFKGRPSSYSGAKLGTAGAQHSTASKKRNTRNMTGDGHAISSKGVNREIDTVDTDENNNEEWNLRDKSRPLMKMLDDLKKVEHPCQQRSSVEVARTVSDENKSQSPSNEQAASVEHSTAGKKRYSSRNWSGDGDATSSGVNRKTETVDVNENKNEERSLWGKSLPLKKKVEESGKIERPNPQGSSVEVAGTLKNENTSQSLSNEQAALGSSYEKAGALKSGYSSVCPIGMLGSWTPRHLCITTGSKLLRGFAESCTVSPETNPIENSSTREADIKQQKDGDAYAQSNESKVLPSSGNSCIENLPSSLKSNGGLIEQGVRIVVVIVACGLLLKSV